MEDVKPVVGHVPVSEPLRPSTVGKDYFKVELLVGKDEQVLLPFFQDPVCRELSIDYYTGLLGLPFAVRVSLTKPRTEGTLYGARVYIDSGKAGREVVYKKWAEADESGDVKAEHPNETVDTAKADHYFWIPAGKTEHTIRGFYKSPRLCHAFKFGDPRSNKRGLNSDMLVGEDGIVDSIGTIRIAFSSVEKFQPFQLKRSEPPPRPQAVESVETKPRLTAKPGRVVKDGYEPPPDGEEAVLEEKVIFERRIVYNSYEGFKVRHFLERYLHTVDFYKGMPLKVFTQGNVRKQAIQAFVKQINSARIDKSNADRIQQANQGEPVIIHSSDANDFVRVEDIVHFICKSVSPAASYIICTGKEKQGNYGERQVQRFGFSLEDGLQDYAVKERELVSFFKAEPGCYDIELDGYDETRQPRENYKVKFAVFVIDSDSDSDSD